MVRTSAVAQLLPRPRDRSVPSSVAHRYPSAEGQVVDTTIVVGYRGAWRPEVLHAKSVD